MRVTHESRYDDVEELRKRFEEFRSQHKTRTRLPEELWRAAAEIAGRRGMNLVSRCLRLDANSVKKWMGARPDVRRAFTQHAEAEWGHSPGGELPRSRSAANSRSGGKLSARMPTRPGVVGQGYQNDALAREQKLSPEARLRFHQEHSGPVMKELQEWMKAQLAEHRTEPNSGLGKAISYLLNHWIKLTLFLSQPGAPIDNNLVERALKKAILNRRNAFFYKTLNGAHTGDLFMSLIHTPVS
jgi:Transposase IS66 family